MEETKPFNYLAVIIVIIVLLAGGYFLWDQAKHKNDDQNQTASDWAAIPLDAQGQKILADQKKFSSTAEGFSVTLPDGWERWNTSEGEQFLPHSEVLAQKENAMNCAQKKPECNSEFIIKAVNFSNTSSLKDASGGVTKTTINNVEYSTFKTNGLVDSFCYEAKSGTKTVSFCSLDKDTLDTFMQAVSLN